jgi:hypothetical protein
MINVRKVHPSGALEVNAMVMDLKTREVWLQRKAYVGYTKQEAISQFRGYLAGYGLGLVND